MNMLLVAAKVARRPGKCPVLPPFFVTELSTRLKGVSECHCHGECPKILPEDGMFASLRHVGGSPDRSAVVLAVAVSGWQEQTVLTLTALP